MSKENQNPQTMYPRPPFPVPKKKKGKGSMELQPQPDHGEESYIGSGKLNGKVAVITGGDSGIGKAVAIAFAREGANIVLSYLDEKEEEDALTTATYIMAAGHSAVLVPGDIRSEKHCQKIVRKAVKEWGKIDILVNNAGFQMKRDGLQDIPSKEFVKTFETNVFSTFYLCKAAEPFIPPGGVIINTASVNAYHPTESLLAYAATKAAIQNFTANLSQLLLHAGKGIRVNCVAPGPVLTPLQPDSGMYNKDFGADTPMGRPAQPAEMAAAFVYLACSDSSYVSGATLEITGGSITL